MVKTISLRRNVRIISFLMMAFLILSVFAISGYKIANKYRRELEYTYTRALNELSDYISNLEMTLNKGIYANTLPQQQGLSNKIMAQSMGAKCALEQLPIDYSEAQNINKFISQTSEYANSLSNTILNGNKVSDSELENLKKLGVYAKSVNTDLKNMLEKVNLNPKNITQLAARRSSILKNTTSAAPSYVQLGFKEIDDSFADYPTLIYDGPFSDHLIRRSSKFLESQEVVSVESAKQKIVNLFSLNEQSISYIGDIEGNLPCYRFNTSSGEVLVTKNGGYINSLVNEHSVSVIKLGFYEAKKVAEDFMKKLGYENLKESYYIINDGVCTINYAFCKDNVIYYTDLIKIGVSLDIGNVVFFDATGYLMNHTERNVSKDFAITLETAQKNVSKRLSIKSTNKAIIPTSGMAEVACYEFECIGENNDNVLVYINAKNGLEEQIFVLINSANGTLVM